MNKCNFKATLTNYRNEHTSSSSSFYISMDHKPLTISCRLCVLYYLLQILLCLSSLLIFVSNSFLCFFFPIKNTSTQTFFFLYSHAHLLWKHMRQQNWQETENLLDRTYKERVTWRCDSSRCQLEWRQKHHQ